MLKFRIGVLSETTSRYLQILGRVQRLVEQYLGSMADMLHFDVGYGPSCMLGVVAWSHHSSAVIDWSADQESCNV